MEQKDNNMAEIHGATTNTQEQANAPKDSGEQQVAQSEIAEGQRGAGQRRREARDIAEQAAAGARITGRARRLVHAGPRWCEDDRRTAAAGKGVARRAGAAERDPGGAPRAERDRTPAEKADAAKAYAEAEKARAAGAEMVRVTVDGAEVEVPKGTLAIEACLRAGADVPYFCYHPRLTSIGACRMCLVNVEYEAFGSRTTKMLTCCTVPVTDGMAIRTDAPRREEGAERDAGVPAGQPPAGLPGLRPGRRVPAAEHDGGLRPAHVALHRGEAALAQGLPDQRLRRPGPRALHPVHALHPLLRGDLGRRPGSR